MQKSVLIVGNFYASSSGSYGVCVDLARWLAEADWTVTTTSSAAGRFPRLMQMLSTVWLKRRAFAVAQIDVYSGRAFLWAEAVCEVLRWIGKPYVLTLHGGNLPAFGRLWSGRMRRLLQSAAAVTTPSRYLYEHMMVYRRDLRLLPNALDVGRYKYDLRKLPRPRLLWLRAFHQIYNPSLCPKVLYLVSAEFPNARLVMAGPDKKDGSLELTLKVARELNIIDKIDMPGPIGKSRVPECLGEQDVFLNTSNIDNTPVSILEAMASGLCIVSTNVGGIPYLLEHGKNALLVPPDDAESMAQAVRSILHAPTLAESLSRSARNTAEQFDSSFIVPKWESLLNSISHGAAYP